MKKILFIFLVLSFAIQKIEAQQRINIDSLKAANKVRTDSIRALNKTRRDSIEAVRIAREKAIKAKKKNAKKNSELESFPAEDPKDSITIARELRMDSLKAARMYEAEKRKKDLLEKRGQLIAMQKKIIHPLTQEMSIGYRLASDGWSLFVQRGFIKTDAERLHTNFIFVDLSEKRNAKETRSMNENFTIVNPNELKPTSYKYGKINNFYQFKLGYGNSIPISGKLDKKSVQISWLYAGGLSMGILKPYYLDLLIPEGNIYVRKFEKYSEKTKEYFLDLNNQGTIVGGSSFTKGIGEIKIQPGLALRSGFYFDYTASRKTFLGVEIGASAELYMKKIPIMVTNSNSAYFFNVYADFRFGRRWE